ncbi:MAG TPA: right-handed parallel beta-helix repeat-containing protein [Longimicrobiales bacterium]
MSIRIRAGLPALLIALGSLGACVDDAPGPVAPIERAQVSGLSNVIMVTSTSGGTETGSLRWAVSQAAAGDVIRFDPSLTGATITLDQAAQSVEPITIEGPADEGIILSGGDQVRIFDLSHTGTTTLRNLTITKGRSPSNGSGGGIFSTGGLTLEHTTVTGNVSVAAGAMYVNDLTLINSTVSGNTSTSTDVDYPVIIGGGEYTFINSTVAKNSPAGSTTADVMVLRNSLFADNGPGGNCTGIRKITHEGTNIADDDTCGAAPLMVIDDAQLVPLADNGGPSVTHAFALASPALDAGTSCTVAVDQRYVPRDAKCDVGAFEFTDFTTIDVTIDASQAVNPNTGWVVVTGTMTCSRDEAIDLEVELSQQVKTARVDGVVEADGTMTAACTTAVRPWSIVLVPPTGSFRNGAGTVQVRTVNTPAWAMPAATSMPVKLFWGHK